MATFSSYFLFQEIEASEWENALALELFPKSDQAFYLTTFSNWDLLFEQGSWTSQVRRLHFRDLLQDSLDSAFWVILAGIHLCPR